MKTKLLFITTAILFCSDVFSQSISPQVIATSGADFTLGNFTLSWTLGESVIETFSDPNNILSQGFQQPFYLLTDLNQSSPATISVNIYPNPSANLLTINFSQETTSITTIGIFDMLGQMITTKTLPPKTLKAEMDISKFAQAGYFLKIISTEQNIFNTYKIQKIR